MVDRLLVVVLTLRTLVFVIAICAPSVGNAQPPSKSPEPKAGRNLDSLKIPPGTVVIVSDNPREAFQNVDAVVLSPDEYRKLVEAADQARRPTAPDRPEVPSVCRIGGKIESRGNQDIAVLRIVYQFRTTAARTMVVLGLQKGKPIAARFADGRLPVLQAGKDDEGLLAQIEGAGEHSLTVDVEAPLSVRSARAGERGFELGLPGSAITAIENLQLPDRTTRARVGGRTVPIRLLAQPNSAFVLGPVPRLEVVWDLQHALSGSEPLTSVDGVVDVRIEEKTVTTHARLSIKIPRGVVEVFQIQTPANTELTLETSEPTVKVERPKEAKSSTWVIRREPTTDELRLGTVSRTELKTGEPIRVVVPNVLGANTQRGTITVNGPPNVRLSYRPVPGSEITRRDGGEDAARDPAFQYWRVPDGPLLDIDVSPIRGEVETSISHQFALTELGVRWQGKIDVRPIRTEVGHLDLEVPTDLQEFRAATTDLVDTIQAIRESGRSWKPMRVQLAESRRRPFTVVLEGLFPVATGAASASLLVPHLTGTHDKGGSVTASVPGGLEVRAGLHDGESGRVGDWERPLDASPRSATTATAVVERTPARLELSWRSLRGDPAVVGLVHIFLEDRQAMVRCSWTLPPSLDSAKKFILRGPATLAGRLRASEGCSLTGNGPGEWTVLPTASTFSVAYSFSVPSSAGTAIPVALVWLDPCPRCETDVRIWTGPTLGSVRAEGPWTELPLQPVPEQPDFPSLCLHGTGTQLPLSLAIQRSEGTGPSVVERLWGQSLIDTDGQQTYRVRAWLRANRGRVVAVELPTGIEPSQVSVILDGKRLAAVGEDQPRRWLLPAAESLRDMRLVEFLYSRRPVSGLTSLATIELPRFLGCEPPPTRLQVGFTSTAVPLAWAEGYELAESLQWTRGIPLLRPARTTADNAMWFASEGRRPRDTELAVAETLDTGILATGTNGALRLLLLPRATATLVVSSLALAACVGMAVVRRSRVRSILVGAIAVAMTIAVVYIPQPTGRLMLAAVPGLLAIPLAFAVRALVQRRYRSRLQFLPGFARGIRHPGSSLRVPSAQITPREPSTVDAPPHAPGLSSSKQAVS